MSDPQALVLVDRIPSLLEPIISSLKGEGYDVRVTSDCDTASRLVGRGHPSIVVVGNLGDQMSRWEFCKLLRADAPPGDTAIIVAIAKSSRLTAIRCLEEGADACIPTPLTREALVGQIRMLRRTMPGGQAEVLSYRGLEVNLTAQRVTYEGRRVRLNVTAIALLACLVRTPDRDITRDELVAVLGPHSPGGLRRVDAYIHRIRRAFVAAGCPHVIRTVRMHGYGLTTG
jgi:DNA-binding response OmpR family regulator